MLEKLLRFTTLTGATIGGVGLAAYSCLFTGKHSYINKLIFSWILTNFIYIILLKNW